ncbi:MAG: CaiB/BaiF CoA transferase family protein [Hyphomicrobiales bacterium]
MRTNLLTGLRVVEMGNAWAGPYAARLLADMGAEVIKVEAPRHPDLVRFSVFPDNDPGDVPWERGAHYQKFGRNKKSCIIDVAQERGRDLFLRLLARSDVFLENNTPRVRDQLGLSDGVLRSANPKLIILSMPGFGNSGPYRDYLAYGLTIEGFTGLSSVTGYEDDEVPVRSAVPYGDPVAAMHGAIAVLAAVRRLRRAGEASSIELAQHESLASLLPDVFFAAQRDGRDPEPVGNATPNAHVLQDAFETQGGDWIAVTASTNEDAGRLRAVTGGDGDLRAAVGAWAAGRSQAEAVRALQEAGVAAAPVASPRQMMEHEQVRALGLYEEVAHPLYQAFPYSRIPLGFAGNPAEPDVHAPLFGEHNRYVFQELLGLSDAEVDALYRDGITADRPDMA